LAAMLDSWVDGLVLQVLQARQSRLLEDTKNAREMRSEEGGARRCHWHALCGLTCTFTLFLVVYCACVEVWLVSATLKKR
jgi:hypothetical protein